MAKNLVIVESPAKAKTINKYLGRDFTVKASMGHVRDLPKKKLGVDVKKGFAAEYEALPARKKVLDELKAAAKDAEAVYLAADPDREGEAICWHLSEALGGRSRKKYRRVVFNEITKKAVQQAFEHPVDVDPKKVDVFIGNVSITSTEDQLRLEAAVGNAARSAITSASADARQSFGTDSVTQQIDMGFAGDVGIAPTMGHSVPLQGEIISTPPGVTESKAGQ